MISYERRPYLVCRKVFAYATMSSQSQTLTLSSSTFFNLFFSPAHLHLDLAPVFYPSECLLARRHAT